MKKKSLQPQGKKLELKKIKIMPLQPQQIDSVKGGNKDQATKTIKSFDVGCTYGTF